MSKLSQAVSSLPGVVEDIDICRIVPSNMLLRTGEGGVQELALSIKQIGLLQPIVVRAYHESYQIVAGHRRFEACKIIGWRKIACLVVELEDKASFELSLIENIQRKTLNPLEEGRAFRLYVSNFGWGGISDLALKISKSVSYITKRISLLDLPQEVRDKVSASLLSPSVAEELLYIRDKEKQSHLANLVLSRHLTLRKARSIIRNGEDQGEMPQNALLYDTGGGFRLAQRSIDRSIIALRIAVNRIGQVAEDAKEDWMLYEMLMQQKHLLSGQIDLLIREKKKRERKTHS